jgi:hypothetical protein
MSSTDLKVLTIGNSFTESLHSFFWQAAESAGRKLLLAFANHGGCELHRHWEYVKNEELDGAYSLYAYSRSPDFVRETAKSKLREILKREPWDVVSIQQASHFSWRPETYEPFASLLRDYVKLHAPQAELVVQQTWAYNVNDSRLQGEWPAFDEGHLKRARALGATVDDGPWRNVTQDAMHDALDEAYKRIAKKLNLRIIPTGFAVKLARASLPEKLAPYAPELEKSLRWPDMPPKLGQDVVGSFFWRKSAKTGELEFCKDTIHLNRRGEYLQACVWFAALFGGKTSEIGFVPDCLGDADARFLREIAQKAVDGFAQVAVKN